MRNCLRGIIAFAFVIPVVAAWSAPPAFEAKDGVALFAEPLLLKGLGGSSYDLSFDAGGGTTGLSRLEFPLQSLEAGAAVGLTISRGGKRIWLVQLEAARSTLAMGGSMNDYDWMQPVGYPRIPFSYTYSDDCTTSWRARAEVSNVLFSAPRWSVGWDFFYLYQSSSHVEDGATGWQYAWNSTAGAYDLYVIADHRPDVLEYSLTSHTVGFGVAAAVAVAPSFSVSLTADYAPVYVSDQDDHKLRTKLSTSFGWGHGLYADLRATYLLHRIGGITPYISLWGDVIYYVVDTTQDQYWYGNADAANGAPQGTRVSDVGHTITSEQVDVGLSVGFAF